MIQQPFLDYSRFHVGCKNNNMFNYAVVIPTKNRPEFLFKAISSVYNQTLSPNQIIIVDNSTKEKLINENKKVFLAFLKRKNIPIEYSFLKNCKNASEARNFGAKKVSNTYLAFLDDDDEWDRYKIEYQYSEIKEEIGAYTSIFVLDKKSNTKIIKNNQLENLNKYNSLGGCSGMLLKKSIFDTLNGFDNNLLSSQDWDLWIKLTQVTDIYICDKSKVIYSNYNKEKISRNLYKKYFGHRSFFFKNKHFLDKKYLLFELIIYRSKYYGNISFINILILSRICNYQYDKITSFLRVVKIFSFIFFTNQFRKRKLF